MRAALRATFSLLVGAMQFTVPARAADDELGAFLAQTCAACHRPGTEDSAIPPIAGLDEADFVALIEAYRSSERGDAIMQAVAKSLSAEDTAALAHYLAGQAAAP
jgi:cytochrome c